MLTQLVELRQCSLNLSSLDNAYLPGQAQALASLLTLSSSGFSQFAHLFELGLDCQFGHRVQCHSLRQCQYYHPIELGLQCQFGWWVWCHSPGWHQYYHPIELGLQCRFDWRVRCHQLGQHQHHHWYLGIQLHPKEEGQPFDAVPLLREY